MLRTWLATTAVLLVLVGGWLLVQFFARRFARNHPEFGEFREAGGGCGGGCGSCEKKPDETGSESCADAKAPSGRV